MNTIEVKIGVLVLGLLLIASVARMSSAQSCTSNFVIGISGASANKSPTDVGLTSYTTEYFSYLTGKYGSNVTTKSYIIAGTGSAQQNGDPDNCGIPEAGYNVNQWIADSVNVIILRVRQSDTTSAGCSAAADEAAVLNVYNESVAAGITIWIETAAPVGNDPTMAATRSAITTYILANFPRVIDATTGFVQGTGSSYIDTSAYFGDVTLPYYNIAGNTLMEQRTQSALGY